MRFTGTPPAVVNRPPTQRTGPVPPSKTRRVRAVLFRPEPRGAQVWPFHLAMRLAGAPPAEVNSPAAYRAGPVPSSQTARSQTWLLRPLPSPRGTQEEPVHFAM